MPEPERNCGNCACGFLAKHPQEIGRTQLLCRRNGPMLLQQRGRLASGEEVSGMSLSYAPTDASLVCYDGWRPQGTLPGAGNLPGDHQGK